MAAAKQTRNDSNPKTKAGATGFVQEYNEDPGVRQDLNPDAVTDDSVLPDPIEADATPTRRVTKRGTRKAKR